MLRSMFAGVSGLRASQTMVDVTGNNIANVNTTGFRSSRVLFSEVLGQSSGSSGVSGQLGAGGRGGINPSQVGLGVRVAGVQQTTGAGMLQLTNVTGDMALQGNGFFTIRNGSQQVFTRAGAFHFDNVGQLVDAGGNCVQGWKGDATGKVNTNGPVSDIVAGAGTTIPATATTQVTVGGNLPASAKVGDSFDTSIDVYDSLGAPHRMTATMTKTGTNTWSQVVADDTGTTLTPAAVTLTFNPADGTLTSAVPAPSYAYAPAGASPMTFTTDYGVAGSPGSITQLGSESSMSATDQNGSAEGFLRQVGISDGGTIVGTFSNGETRVLAQVAVATIDNPDGLAKMGDNMYEATPAAGNVTFGAASTGGRGDVVAGALESSNVDLAQEFTNLIIAQRGFQANSRVITTSDEMLNDLVSLKR